MPGPPPKPPKPPRRRRASLLGPWADSPEKELELEEIARNSDLEFRDSTALIAAHVVRLERFVRQAVEILADSAGADGEKFIQKIDEEVNHARPPT